MAAELVGGALLSSFFQFAFDKLASGDILDYFRERKLDERLLQRLNGALNYINAVIDDAENKQIENDRVKTWVVQVKDAVFDAEDLLDEIDTELSKREEQEAESGTRTTCKVCTFFGASSSSFDKQIEARMKQVLDNLENLAKQKDILGLTDERKLVSQRITSTEVMDETVTYGRKDEKEIIINWLLSDQENGSSPYSVISVVGMGGLGKTTLAQLVYNDERLKNEFDLKAWVCVSEEFDLIGVTRMILGAITSASVDAKELNVLQLKLKESLIGKRFLLVLDDVWNENHMQWEALKTPFIYGAHGSKILITSRSAKVASAARAVKIHELMQLLEESSWLLFSKYAFGDRDSRSNPDLEEIGRKIVMKCKGLPLALKAIGCLLYGNSSCEKWNDILRSEIWDMPYDETNILPALRLSYCHLPSLLKRCFAYCSIFPKDYAFEKEDLVQLWMAESLLPPPQQNKSIKEVGDLFFNDLLARSFFQRSSEYKGRFVMHDLVNDLAKYVTGEFCFRLGGEETQQQIISKKTRYFSTLGGGKEVFKQLEDYKLHKLRSFLNLRKFVRHSISSNVIDDFLSKNKHLRALSLYGQLLFNECPNSLGKLKHMRYLDLSFTEIRKLPNSTCLLYNLQTLKLQHCSCLVELPSDLHKLVNLQHLDIRETNVRKMPKHLRKLRQLQVLTTFCVGTGPKTGIEQLEELNLWGELSILELQNVSNPMNALAANLKNKIHLEKLTLEWSVDNDESQKQEQEEVLEKLQPHKDLKELSVICYSGTKFPDWFRDNSLRIVVSLKLHNCKYCSLLPPLGLLPSLKALSVMGCDAIVSIGNEFHGNGSCTIPFRLEILEFRDMLGWEEWKCEDKSEAFPSLQTLSVENCPKLKKQLLEQLPSLNSLAVVRCQQLVASVPRATTIKKLTLSDSGWLQLGYTISSLKYLRVSSNMEGSLLKNIQHTISNSCLEQLDIYFCGNMEFPMQHCHNFLISVNIESSCESLRTFPLNFFPKLQSLYLSGCSDLEMIHVSEGNDHFVTSLVTFQIRNSPKFVSLSTRGWSAPKLFQCVLQCLESLKSLPECMDNLFPSLEVLELDSCPQLESFPDGGLPSNLMSLSIQNCSKLFGFRLQWGLQKYSSLESLLISDGNVLSFPDKGLLPPSLTSLTLYDCPKLKTLDYEGLCNPSSLRRLSLEVCPRLQCLPKEGLPRSISSLIIFGCPLLKMRCLKLIGKDWRKIAYISDLHILP